MKRLTIILLSVLVAGALANPLFGKDEQPKPTFVEEPNIPEGKALVYIYMTPHLFGGGDAVWVLTKDGPAAVCSPGWYSSYFADAGPLKLWPLDPAKGVHGDKLTPTTADFMAGQTYYIRVNYGGPLTIVPAEKAKTNGEVLYCKKLDE